MKQIFCFGSSSIYGVGSATGSWVDLIKQYAHQLMYGEDGIGEKIEVFNFGKSGATINFVASNYHTLVKSYGRKGSHKLALVNVGGNNSKASGSADNYVSQPEEYQQELTTLLQSLQSDFDQVIFVGSGYVDESKTMPKISPFDGRMSYFSNERRSLFDRITEDVCRQLNIVCIMPKENQDTWCQHYLYQDGLHSNQHGYHYIFDLIKPYIDAFITQL